MEITLSVSFILSDIFSLMCDKENKKFGKHLMKKFQFNPNLININCGSFGSPPRVVGEAYHKYQAELESNPDKFIIYIHDNKINETRLIVSNYLRVNIDNIFFVENASDGANIVFKSIIEPKWKILAFDCVYLSLKNTLNYLKEKIGIEIIIIKLTEERINSDEEMLKLVKETLDEHPDIKFATIDHISSTPAVIFPIKEIIALLRSRRVISFIDGAHSVGQIKFDLNDIQPDFYVSNFHKWGMAAKSVSFLFVKSEFIESVHPNIIGNNYGKGKVNEFAWVGTKDYSAIFTIKDAIDFRKQFGEDDIINHNHALALNGGEIFASIWHTELLVKDPNRVASMVDIRLPINNERKIKDVVYKMIFEHHVYLKCFQFNGKFYARISAQIFNEEEDYKKVAQLFINLINQ